MNYADRKIGQNFSSFLLRWIFTLFFFSRVKGHAGTQPEAVEIFKQILYPSDRDIHARVSIRGGFSRRLCRACVCVFQVGAQKTALWRQQEIIIHTERKKN